MSFIAIVGAGAIGGALAQRLASRDRAGDVRLIDPEGRVAQGKALDIQQSSPIDGFGTRLSGSDRLEAAAGARVIVIADAAQGDAEHAGESGLALVKRIAAMDTSAPLLFAGAAQRMLMQRSISELHVSPRRVIGAAPGALESAVRALAALECDGSAAEVQLRVVGVPPEAAVVLWEEATVFGKPLGSVIPAHRVAAIGRRLPSLWPPGPIALASAAARAAEAILHGSRRRLTCFVALDRPPNRGAVVALPAGLGPLGVDRVVEPALTRQEQTRLDNALSR